jgi:hypothetical protein
MLVAMTSRLQVIRQAMQLRGVLSSQVISTSGTEARNHGAEAKMMKYWFGIAADTRSREMRRGGQCERDRRH